MSFLQRRIRTLKTSTPVPVEERPQTTQIVLALWALVVAGIVVWRGEFENPNPWANGWFQLGMLATAWGVLAWLAAATGRWLGSRLRFGVASSLVLHSLLAIVLMLMSIEFLATPQEQATDRNEVAKEEEPPVRVEIVQPTTPLEQAFEKPLPTEALVEMTPQPELERAAQEMAEVAEPTPQPEALASAPEPQSLIERPPRTALTHRARSPGVRSRQSRTASLANAEPVEVLNPDTKLSNVATNQSPSNPSTELARNAPAPTAVSAPADKGASASPQAERRLREETPEANVATRRPRVPQVPPLPPTEATPPTVAQVDLEPVPTPEITPAAAAAQPRLAATRPGVANTPVPEVERPVPQSSAMRRDTRVEDQPLAQAPTPRQRRQQVELAQVAAETPQTSQLADTTQTRRTPNHQPQPLGPTPADRHDPPAAAAREVAEAPTTVPIAPRVEPSRERRTLATNLPTLREAPEMAPRTASPLAALATPETTLAPNAAPASRTATVEPSTSPAPRVLAESRGGTAGTGEGLNMVDDAPAAESYMAPFASAMAERERASQTERGPALDPLPVARTPHSRAAAPVAASSLQAVDVPQAQVAGSERPQQRSTPSSAALERQFSDAPLGDTTAAVGTTQADTGPPQVTPERGAGRGDQGGRIAQHAPTVRSGLGPRRREATVAAAGVVAGSSPSEAAAPAPSSAAVVAAPQATAGGAATDGAPGELANTSLGRMAPSRVPFGHVAGGGATPPPIGPPPAAAQLGEVGGPSAAQLATGKPSAPSSGGTSRESASRAAGPTIATAPRSPREGGARSRETVAIAADPGAVALAVPVSSGLQAAMGPGGSGSSIGPAINAERDATPGRESAVGPIEDVGGLGNSPSPDPGLARRIARRQADPLRMTPGRYANRNEGGTLAPTGRERRTAPAFAPRGERLEAAPPAHVADNRPKTEAAIELGLEFLAPLQLEDGRWGLAELGELPIDPAEIPAMKADGAVTGLALLAFLGAGYDHFGDKYQRTVQRGLDYLVEQQGERGDIFPERHDSTSQLRFYSHGIAALALCEAYGMTGDPELREPAQRALDYIVETQHRSQHGWRYSEQREADLSVTGWQMMALRSGQLAGLRVPRETYIRLERFIEACREPGGERAMFCYNPYITDQDPLSRQHGRHPGTVMTSVGMLMELYLGETRQSPRMQAGARHLLANLPTHGEPDAPLARSSTPNNPLRDTYYWYYATQVMFHMGGEHWQRWHEHLHPLLVDHQTQEGPLAGSWNPRYPVRDRWSSAGGRIYVTCLNLLSLEVSYRHLPLYEMTAQ